MTITRAKSKKAASNICPEISNKISTREALFVVEATRQNVLEAFPLFSNCEKLSLVATKATFSSLAGLSPVKVPLKRHTWEQLLTSAIVTPNPFVVSNEILDEISIASSDTLSKMGQDQLLAVLPNVVSFSRSLPVLKAKQSLPVRLPVLENWTDQMETELSSLLVSGATSSDCFSVMSLKVASLVELTSFVYLAILKIAKSLVVSESDFPSVVVALYNMLLGVSAADIKTALSVFGMVTCVVLKSADIWQYVVIHFENLVAVTFALNYWSVLVSKDSVRILPFINQQETIVSHNKFKAKLVNLPSGCTAFEISDMISQVGGQTCFIPWFPDSDYCFHFALVTFGFQADLNFAIIKTGILKKCRIWWKTPGCKHCFRCQGTGYLAVDCKMSLPSPLKTPKVFNLHVVSNVFYAKVSVSLNVSGFFPLVAFDLLASSLAAFFAASIADSAVELRLNSMKKQILDLTALVKFVIEPIGSLVTTLLNDNTVKTLKVEKDFLTMYNVFKGFADLLVSVFKNFASLKAEVKFGDLDDDNIGAAKTSLLSDDTINHAVALW
ncbi:hypothetical protein G9A89_023702 [Geosiphon pyriformis]|nr:hypothetical protein G9A89_023702 [Geosiphon pyriformis]